MANSPSSNPQQSDGDRQATVLVVDDDPILQTMILDYFADNNIQTLLASGREEMLRQLARQEVNVVILDLRTPFCLSSCDSGGVDFSATLRDERVDLSGKVTLQGSNGIEFGMPFCDPPSDIVLRSLVGP